ncbi:MAG: hypothetical protein HY594_04705 [Candidatus Omnitrophica bacterium]|nr:hypothetical protein [Candidatus Omnitrophota bacterium]
MKRSGGAPAGFTLVEILLSAAIAAAIFAALATVIGGGFAAWRKSEEISLLTREGTRALHGIEDQLLQSLASEDFPFEGNETSLQFVAGDETGPAQIRWSYERPFGGGQGTWVASRKPIVSQKDPPIAVPESRQEYGTVESVEFLFPYADAEQSSGYVWQKQWADDENRKNVPQAVWIRLHLRGPRQGEIALERIVVLPHGRLGTVEQAP